MFTRRLQVDQKSVSIILCVLFCFDLMLRHVGLRAGLHTQVSRVMRRILDPSHVGQRFSPSNVFLLAGTSIFTSQRLRAVSSILSSRLLPESFLQWIDIKRVGCAAWGKRTNLNHCSHACAEGILHYGKKLPFVHDLAVLQRISTWHRLETTSFEVLLIDLKQTASRLGRLKIT